MGDDIIMVGIHTYSFILCTLLMYSNACATFIKKSAFVLDIKTGKPFAMLYDSTYITEGITIKGKQPYIETKAEISPINIEEDNLYCEEDERGNCSFELIDTAIIQNTAGDTIGKIWNPFNLDRNFPEITDKRDLDQGLEVHIKGLISSTSLYEHNPWYTLLEAIDSTTLFKETYYTLSTKLRSIHSRFRDEYFDEYKSVVTYDHSLPTAKPSIQYFFESDVLKALWVSAKLKGQTKTRFNSKWLYYDSSLKKKLNVIKTMICESTYKPSGDIFTFNTRKNRCQ